MGSGTCGSGGRRQPRALFHVAFLSIRETVKTRSAWAHPSLNPLPNPCPSSPLQSSSLLPPIACRPLSSDPAPREAGEETPRRWRSASWTGSPLGWIRKGMGAESGGGCGSSDSGGGGELGRNGWLPLRLLPPSSGQSDGGAWVGRRRAWATGEEQPHRLVLTNQHPHLGQHPHLPPPTEIWGGEHHGRSSSRQWCSSI